VLLRNSASWAVHPVHCRQVRIDGMRIHNDVRPNNDGLDIDGSQDVFISNCNIRTGDDAIALKALEGQMPCRDVLVTNCILSSTCAAIRVGPDAVADIERVTVSNCVIRDTGLNGIKVQQAMGAAMRDMTFSNIVMDNVAGPISVRLAGWKMGVDNTWSVFDDSRWPRGVVRNILFANIRARAKADGLKSCMFITGAAATKPRDITFSNIDITFPGGGTAAEGARRTVPDQERRYPEIDMFGTLPAYGLYVHHAAGITLSNVQFHLESEDLRPALVCDDVQDLELSGFKAQGATRAESLIRLQNTQRAFVTGSRPLDAIDTFLVVEGAESRDVFLRGNELSLARKDVDGDVGAVDPGR
jgi:polygalacturonase